MNEIEKLYKNANVEDKNINNQLYKDLNYPQFTAEKQLELIKFLLKVEHSISYYFYENRYGFVIDDKQDDCIEAKEFKIALAMIVNSLWQDLTEEEKEQVRSVLNG